MTKNNLLILSTFMLCINNFLPAQSTFSCELFFKPDSFDLSADQQIILQTHVKNLDTVTISGISISAFCDDIGTTKHNEALSFKRANYIKELLLKYNIDKKLINHPSGKGELQLIKKDSNTQKQRTFNRRAELNISYSLKEKNISKPTEITKKTINKDKSKLSDDQKVGDKITLENILFVGGRHQLLPESYEDLEILTTTLLDKKKYHIVILGHICCVHNGHDGLDYDTGQYNLSAARAKVIWEYLIAHGVNSNRLSYKGLKADYPTGKADKYDRRVEIEITDIVSE